jgi:hypothetical protein
VDLSTRPTSMRKSDFAETLLALRELHMAFYTCNLLSSDFPPFIGQPTTKCKGSILFSSSTHGPGTQKAEEESQMTRRAMTVRCRTSDLSARAGFRQFLEYTVIEWPGLLEVPSIGAARKFLTC